MAVVARRTYDWYSICCFSNISVCCVYRALMRWLSCDYYRVFGYINARLYYSDWSIFSTYGIWFNDWYGVYV